MDNVKIGERIKERRLELGLTLQNIADEINVNKSTIQKYESGTIKKLKLPVVEAIAKYLNVNPSWLLGESEIKKHSEEYERVTHLSDLHFRGVMIWSQDQFFDECETIIIREHFSDLLLRYKELITKLAYTKRMWESDKDSFEKLYENRLTKIEIRELFLKQELEHQIKAIENWINSFPNWVARNEFDRQEDN